MTNAPGKTRTAFLLDETSSMIAHKTNTISGLREYIDTLKAGDTDIDFSLITFSNIRTQTVVKNAPIKVVDVDAIAAAYKPQGSTPLIDAAMKTIKAMDEAAKPGERVVIVFQTDGEEYCSTEFKLADLQAAIKAKSDLGWQFVFLGAGLDAYQAAAKYGIHAGQTMSYGIDALSTRSAFRGMGETTQSFASGDTDDVSFSAEQKQAAGDIWQPQPDLPKASSGHGTTALKPKPIVDDIVL